MREERIIRLKRKSVWIWFKKTLRLQKVRISKKTKQNMKLLYT